MEKLDVCPCCVVEGTWRPWYTLFANHLGAIMLAETHKLKKWPTRRVVAYVRGRTRRRCTSCRSERLTCLSTPMQQFASIRSLLRCSRSAAIRILLTCLPSATVLIMRLSYQRKHLLKNMSAIGCNRRIRIRGAHTWGYVWCTCWGYV